MLDQAHRLREIASIERRKRLDDSKHRARRIAVTSGKGGVGKSNLALNFSILASMLRKKTLLIDADTNLANIDILLGLSLKYNLSHVLAGYKSCSEIILEGPSGISILPAASGSIEQMLNEGVASESIIADLNMLEGYGVQFRYPGYAADKDEAKMAYQSVLKVREFVRVQLKLP